MRNDTDEDLAREVIDYARFMDRKLRADWLQSRLLSGKAALDEYAHWLVQLYKLANATDAGAARALASAVSPEGAPERMLRFDLRISHDLARLWNVSSREARARAREAADAPALDAWANYQAFLRKHLHAGAIGIALALEAFATLQADELVEAMRNGIAGERGATTFLAACQSLANGLRAQRGKPARHVLLDAGDRHTAGMFAHVTLMIYRELVRFIGASRAQRKRIRG